MNRYLSAMLLASVLGCIVQETSQEKIDAELDSNKTASVALDRV